MFIFFIIFIKNDTNSPPQTGGAPETELQPGRGAAEGEDWPEEAGAEGHVAPLSSGRQDVAAVRQLGQVRCQSVIRGKYFSLSFNIILLFQSRQQSPAFLKEQKCSVIKL